MKKITRTVTKEVQETVQVCDTCGQERPLVIDGFWSVRCGHDGCYDDSGRFEFCSFACFKAKAAELAGEVDGFESFLTRLTINMNCDADGFEELMGILRAYGGPA